MKSPFLIVTTTARIWAAVQEEVALFVAVCFTMPVRSHLTLMRKDMIFESMSWVWPVKKNSVPQISVKKGNKGEMEKIHAFSYRARNSGVLINAVTVLLLCTIYFPQILLHFVRRHSWDVLTDRSFFPVLNAHWQHGRDPTGPVHELKYSQFFSIKNVWKLLARTVCWKRGMPIFFLPKGVLIFQKSRRQFLLFLTSDLYVIELFVICHRSRTTVLCLKLTSKSK